MTDIVVRAMTAIITTKRTSNAKLNSYNFAECPHIVRCRVFVWAGSGRLCGSNYLNSAMAGAVMIWKVTI